MANVDPTNLPEWALQFPVSGEPLLKNYIITDAAKVMQEHNKNSDENLFKLTRIACCLHKVAREDIAKRLFSEETLDGQDVFSTQLLVAMGLGHLLADGHDLKDVFNNIDTARDCVRTHNGAKIPTGNTGNTWLKFTNRVKESYTEDRLRLMKEMLKMMTKVPDRELEWQQKVDAEKEKVRAEKDEEIRLIKETNRNDNAAREATLKNERDTAVEAAKQEVEDRNRVTIDGLNMAIASEKAKTDAEIKAANDKIKALTDEIEVIRPVNEETKTTFLTKLNADPKAVGWNVGESQTDKLIGLIAETGSSKIQFNKVTEENRVKFKIPQSAFFANSGVWLGLDKAGEKRTLAIFLLSGYARERDLGELTGEISVTKFNSFYGAKTVPNHYFDDAVTAAKSLRQLILKMGSPAVPQNYFKDYNLSEIFKAFTHARSNPLTELVELPKVIFVKTEAKIFEDTRYLKEIIEKLIVAIEIKEERVNKRSIEKAANFSRNLGLFLTGLDRDNSARLISYVCYIAERGYELNGRTYTDVEDLLMVELNNLVKLAVVVENNKKEVAMKKTTLTSNSTEANGKGNATNKDNNKNQNQGKGNNSWNNTSPNSKNNTASEASSSSNRNFNNRSSNWNSGNNNAAEKYQTSFLKRNSYFKSEDDNNPKERKTEGGRSSRSAGGRELNEEERKLVNASKSKLYDVGSLNQVGAKSTKVKVYDNLMKVTRDGYAEPHPALKKAASDGKLKNNGLAFGLCREYHETGKCDSAACKNSKKFKHKIPEEEMRELTNDEFDRKVSEYLVRINL